MTYPIIPPYPSFAWREILPIHLATQLKSGRYLYIYIGIYGFDPFFGANVDPIISIQVLEVGGF